MATRENFFITCAPGLEPILFEECKALRLPRCESQVGGVYFEGHLTDAWRANLYLRTAVRVLWRLHRCPAADENDLYDAVHTVDWGRFLSPEGSLSVQAQSQESKLDHTLFIAQRAKDAICDQFRHRQGKRPSVDKEDPDLRVHLHLWRDRLTVSLDTSGESLHKRGWRVFQGRAPLAETLSAALVIASQWDGRAPFIDPFCGSGSIVIEAARQVANIPAGAHRTFGFERFPTHNPAAWQQMRDKSLAERRPFSRKLTLRGSDLSAEAIEGARQNAAQAEVADGVEFEVCDVENIEWRRGWNAYVTSNPPYGERVGDEKQLAGLFTRLGGQWRQHCEGYHLAFLLGNRRLAESLGFKWQQRQELKNGALECELLQTRIGD